MKGPGLAIAMAIILLNFNHSPAQQPKAIAPQVLHELEQSSPRDAQFNSVHDAVVQTDGRKLVLDWGKMITVDSHFPHKLSDERVADQKRAGGAGCFPG